MRVRGVDGSIARRPGQEVSGARGGERLRERESERRDRGERVDRGTGEEREEREERVRRE